jgi:hypothetical protein
LFLSTSAITLIPPVFINLAYNLEFALFNTSPWAYGMDRRYFRCQEQDLTGVLHQIVIHGWETMGGRGWVVLKRKYIPPILLIGVSLDIKPT